MYHFTDEIRKVIILDGVTYISHLVLEQCEKLESVYIPKSVNEIAWCSFWRCSNLQYVYFEGNAPRFVYPEESAPKEEAPNAFYTEYLFSEQLPVIYHQSNSSGWDTSDWTGFTIQEQEYQVDWSPAG